jgi:hypothetical protein
MADEKRWLQQALADLAAAQDSLKTAAEKGLKSFLHPPIRTAS